MTWNEICLIGTVICVAGSVFFAIGAIYYAWRSRKARKRATEAEERSRSLVLRALQIGAPLFDVHLETRQPKGEGIEVTRDCYVIT